MLPDDTRNKIKDITTGTILEGQQDTGTTIRNYLCAGSPTSTTVKADFEGKLLIKKRQAFQLEEYSTIHNLWIDNLPGEERFLDRGGEARVYLGFDNHTVIKLNDAIYYATWLEFFNSI